MLFRSYEKKILNHLVKLVGISRDVNASQPDVPSSLNEELTELSSDVAKSVLIKTMCAVADANGILHEAEIAFINKVNTRLEHPIILLPREKWRCYEPEVLDFLRETAESER